MTVAYYLSCPGHNSFSNTAHLVTYSNKLQQPFAIPLQGQLVTVTNGTLVSIAFNENQSNPSAHRVNPSRAQGLDGPETTDKRWILPTTKGNVLFLSRTPPIHTTLVDFLLRR